ncbi:hypothetical protein GCM10022247_37780 [Allokutzneria multivorans]|uniref:Uncharacterized protein n=1 Tax=Allokutzneria multivorans TaxID=1142134 RepID=A0ABP7SHA8_9PSEU
MSGEWNACDTLSRDVFRPCSEKIAAALVTASSVPEITTDVGPLTAAIPTSLDRWGVISSSVAWIATIAPPVGSACISRARALTRAAASSSDSAPAMCAAAISPMECPATTSGRTPQDSTSRNNATSSANNAGCAMPVWSRSGDLTSAVK